VEEAPNHLGRAQPSHTLEMGWKKDARVPRGMGSPLYRLKPETRICLGPGAGHIRLCLGQRPDMSGESCLSSFRNFKNRPKTRYSTDFWRRANRVYIYIHTYIYVIHGQVMRIRTYIWLETIRIIEHDQNFCINRIFDIEAYYSSITRFKSNVQQSKPHSENQ
jgi:hypothetical protein